MATKMSHLVRPLVALVALVAAMAVLMVAYSASPAHARLDSCTTIARTTTCTFLPSGSEDTFEVPKEGVSTIHVVAIGAPGAVGLNGGTAGLGARVESGDLKVTPGDTLYVNVGGGPTGGNCFNIACNGGFNGGGSGGSFGGGGGGASDVRTVSREQSGSVDSRLIVAGGGGGSGEGASRCDDIEGDPGPILPGGTGGDAGSDGGDGTSCRSLAAGTGGKAGGQSAGGVGGSPGGQTAGMGGNGSLGLGGNSGGLTGGGGGGGYYGGGGGGGRGRADTREASAGGGGGGSSLDPDGGNATIATTGPSITISYTLDITVNTTGDENDLDFPGGTFDNSSDGKCDVDSTLEGDQCTLRAAIQEANVTSGENTIDFELGNSPTTIALASQLPSITSTVTVDGGSPNPTISGNRQVRVFQVTSGGNLTLNNLTVSRGHADGDGENPFDEFGGGVFNDGGTLTISNSTFSGNSAVFGGGIKNSNGSTLAVSNSTFSGNNADLSGGGIDNAGTATVSNSTFSGNSTDFEGGSIYNSSDNLTLKNSIVANSPSGGDCGGTLPITDSGYNLVEDGTCGVSAANNSLSGDPGLGPLAPNGGPTETHALLEGSTAIDKGNNAFALDTEGNVLEFDQRGEGFPRIVGGTVDIGAFELQPALSINDVSVTEGNSGTTSNATFTVSLSEPSTKAVTVNFSTDGGTATAGSDYLPLAGTITFAPDETSKTVSVAVNGDDEFEPDETFRVDLSNATNATISDAQGIGTITNDDPPPNTAPTAEPDSYSTNEDTPLSGNVLVNDSDPDGDTLKAALVSDAAHGTLTLDADGSFSYTPNANYNGPDSFTYKASDGSADSNEATVKISVISVNDAPEARDDSVTTAEDTPTDIAVLSNDADVDGDALSVANVTATAKGGTVSKNADGTLTYTPAANFNGTDTFSYTVSDGHGGTDTATVNVTVNPVNDAPTVAVAAGGACGTNDRSGTINLTVNDPDGLAGLTLSATDTSNKNLVPASNVTFGGSGASRSLTATALSGKTGTATITVTVTDDDNAKGTVALTLQAGGNSNDTLTGTSPGTSQTNILSGTDILLGQNGDDTLSGMGDKDLLCGARGNDRLSGGADADRFEGGSGTDRATDFTASQGDTRVGIP